MAMILAAVTLLAAIPVVGMQQAGNGHVLLKVTVTDGDSNYVTNLGGSDFRVFEDGVLQDVASVTRIIDLPIAFSLLLDTSNSMERDFARARTVAVDLAKRLRAEDVAEVISVSTQVKRVQPFTNDAARLERAITALRHDGSTALHYALFVTLRDLQKLAATRATQRHHHVIIVVSDGDDTSSLIPFQRLLDLAKRTEAMIYAIGPVLSGRGAEQSALRQLVKETGGGWFVPNRPEDLGKISDQLMADLSSQYMIRYASNNPRRDGKWRRVEVRVNVPKANVRTRSGYFAPSAQ